MNVHIQLNSIWLHTWPRKTTKNVLDSVLLPIDSDDMVIDLYSTVYNIISRNHDKFYNYLASTSGSWQPGQLLERITVQRPSVNTKLEQIISVIQNIDILNSTLPLVALWPSPRGARVISGKSNSPPPNCGPRSNPGVDTMGWVNFLLVLSFPLRGFSLWVVWFSTLVKNQHGQIPIRLGIRRTKNNLVDVLPLNHYLLIYLFIYLFKSYGINFCEWCKMLLGWFSNRMGTSVDDGVRKLNNWLHQWESRKLGTRSRV